MVVPFILTFLLFLILLLENFFVVFIDIMDRFLKDLIVQIEHVVARAPFLSEGVQHLFPNFRVIL